MLGSVFLEPRSPISQNSWSLDSSLTSSYCLLFDLLCFFFFSWLSFRYRLLIAVPITSFLSAWVPSSIRIDIILPVPSLFHICRFVFSHSFVWSTSIRAANLSSTHSLTHYRRLCHLISHSYRYTKRLKKRSNCTYPIQTLNSTRRVTSSYSFRHKRKGTVKGDSYSLSVVSKNWTKINPRTLTLLRLTLSSLESYQISHSILQWYLLPISFWGLCYILISLQLFS